MQEKELTYRFKISEEAWKLLLSLNGEYKYVEYRDTEFRDIYDFLKSDLFHNEIKDTAWFNKRNHNGTLYLMEELESHGLVELDYEAWHMTYVISNLGKEVIKQNQ
jgi:hypothetical protein